MIQLKRVYEAAAKTDGSRFLVERLWPRGVRKENLPLKAWVKDAAPSTQLRQWFGHDPRKWPEFQRRYVAELRHHRASLQPLLAAARSGARVTLVYSSHDTEHNNAVVLKAHLESLLAADAPTPKAGLGRAS
jgi:uncharacterized protein YeaO (DUF488 family)